MKKVDKGIVAGVAVIAIGLLLRIIMIFIYESPNKNTSQISSNSKSEYSSVTTTKLSTQPSAQTFSIGDTIYSPNGETAIRINKVDYKYEITPDVIDGYFYEYYEANSGNIYIAIDADVKNFGKKELRCDEIAQAGANYNNGYEYTGMIIVKDGSTGLTYANITSISPLETKGIIFAIECPEEVYNSNKSLYITFSIDGAKYSCKVR